MGLAEYQGWEKEECEMCTLDEQSYEIKERKEL